MTQSVGLLAARCSGVRNLSLLSADAFNGVDLPQCHRLK